MFGVPSPPTRAWLPRAQVAGPLVSPSPSCRSTRTVPGRRRISLVGSVRESFDEVLGDMLSNPLNDDSRLSLTASVGGET